MLDFCSFLGGASRGDRVKSLEGEAQKCCKTQGFTTDMYNRPIVPHKAVPEVSKGKVYIKKNVPIGIDCDLLNTFHSISTSHSISRDLFLMITRTT